jgi:hypothetical protein
VFVVGIALLALPISIVVYRAARRTSGLSLPVALVSGLAAVVVALAERGNLMALGLPVVLMPTVGLVWLSETVVRKIASRRSA